MSALRNSLAKLVDGHSLSADEAGEALREIVSGGASPALVAAFLTAMRVKGEDEEELYGMASTMRSLCVKVELRDPLGAVDIVGTGGDWVKTINVSTISSLVVASAGVKVAKHGNRAATGVCGSADLLEGLGVNINMGPEEVRRSVDECGFGFMFAPLYHPAMKSVAPIRRELGFRTFFNLLGPLTNPASVGRMLLGVSDNRYLAKMARVLSKLGLERGVVVCSRDGLDEISIHGETESVWIESGETWREVLSPESLGIERSSLEPVVVKSREEAIKNAVEILRGVLSPNDPRVKMILANSAAALMLAGKCSSLREGVTIARDLISEGQAFETLLRVVEVSGGDRSRLEEYARRLA
ncbi:MAG: anthranilate phosphoribosyltransferase [Nitrososphaerota archaeon]